MEEKQLDFNAPLLSVRRFSSITASSGEESKRIEKSQRKIPSFPYHKSDLKSGPVRNPGAVPFLWEQIPGRPRDGDALQARPIEPPKLPPGRAFGVKQQSSNKEPEDPNAIRPQANDIHPSYKISSLDENVTALDNLKESLKEKRDADTEEDVDEAFTDALETLSRTESFLLNCSVTGLSALDGPNMRPSGTFSTDPQTRDFMLGRFLPAAKAMAEETPQHTSRKQPLPREQQRQVKVVSEDRRPPQYHYKPYMLPQFPMDQGEEESEDEDEEDGYDDTGNLSAKACGLFPRFGLKNSFCLLNPIPGMKVRNHVPISSVRKVGTRVKTGHSRPHMEINDEHTWDAVYKHKLASRLKPSGVLEDETKLTSESNHLTYSSDSQTPDGSSPYRILPYRNEAPRSPFHEGSGFLGIPREVKDRKANGLDSYNKGGNCLRDILFHQNNKQELGSLSPMVEKTLYVDSVHTVETPNSKSSSANSRTLMDTKDKDSEVMGESMMEEENLATGSCIENIKNLKILEDKRILDPKIFGVVDSDLPCSAERSILGGQIDRTEGSRQDTFLDQESRSALCKEVPTDAKLDFDNSQPLSADNDDGNSCTSSLSALLPPPLPKSPSESWLLRALPSIPSRNPSLRSYQGTRFNLRKQLSETSSNDPKWETIDKSSNTNADYLRYSEELITPPSLQAGT
ncbi:PREDICTED: uncharacterized protein LOC104609787 [Nelumbo nucifera]|uniref:Uncharacterized protein LOC104609787 n=2 Tax=Nelumbo nucifera TaxID=4432 RepID=A0A1U8B173_NELNU|nr:PREDICTED: uncharacterized protein LOC104609787 [Nelumbo nucifera]XP_010274479.1 PREDICTED: uncharacterized protein LOC104609787 [Nelumbo nucifera]DAD21219.1 TPA_asm: hypothetical protein HUJ06_022682 [Nelumbo nucifera]